MSQHTLSVLVEDTAGALARVAALFARRRYRIAALTVAPTERPGFSRMTIVVTIESRPLEQVIRQLGKLVDVLEVEETPPATSGAPATQDAPPRTEAA
ncbi:acetolactate synthase small subunit [Streptomyces sp. NPDC003077]|uniref:acetolactate synthase small subunit n=1 Tax=Streptomyces sp. NPDC003077 TaxID=3154443 RepID=UPI0033A1053A